MEQKQIKVQGLTANNMKAVLRLLDKANKEQREWIANEATKRNGGKIQ